MREGTKKVLERLLREHDLIFVFGFTPYATYIHADGVETLEISEDEEFQTANAGRWIAIETPEDRDGTYRVSMSYLWEGEPTVTFLMSLEEVIGLLGGFLDIFKAYYQKG